MSIENTEQLEDSVLSAQVEPTTQPDWMDREEVADDQVSIQQLSQMRLTWIRFRRHKPALVGAGILFFMIVLAIIGPWISPETYYGLNFGANTNGIGLAPQWDYRYLLGSDANGHAIMMWILLGARTSLMVGILGATLSSTIGVTVGSVAGFFGGWLDALAMRITDIFLTLPFLPLLILLSAFFSGGNAWFIILIFGFLGWPGVARLIRSYYLTLREQEFTDAARAVGVGSWRIIFRHIMPNALSPVIVSFTLSVAAFIAGEAAIDFLGVGIHEPNVSWGLALSNAQTYLLLGNWWGALFPGLALLLTVLAVNFLGDGLRDALDVKAKVSE